MQKLVGVIGSGSFGTTIAKVLSHNVDVLVYSRKAEKVRHINETHEHMGVALSPRIVATDDISEVAARCSLIYPIVPSSSFRGMMRHLSPYLKPSHILIHGTKGFDIGEKERNLGDKNAHLSRTDVFTMSDVIMQESVVVRVGCLAGPNLSREILDGQPAATVVASPYREVFELGKATLRGPMFRVYASKEITGAELAGALKNIIAIGAGMLAGLGLGQNIWGLLISRGLLEIIHIGESLDIDSKAFLGAAGIGDLVTTASSKNSRNYTFGLRKAAGESLDSIRRTMPELAEGVRTLEIMKKVCDYHKIRAPIVQSLYSMVFEEFDIQKGLEYLMSYPFDADVSFINA